MRIYIALIFFFGITTGTAQTLIEDGQSSLEIKRVKTNGAWEVHTSRYFISVGDNFKKVQTRIKLRSQTGEKVIIDPNKFYLVLDAYKIRVRPIDIKYPFALASIAFVRLYKENETENGVYDSFGDYSFDQYKDCEVTLNYGTERKPRIRSIYFEPNDIKNSLLDIYFSVPKDAKKATFFYGDIKLADIEYK